MGTGIGITGSNLSIGMGRSASSGGYIVDEFSPFAAYSLEQISSTSTNVVRVRRSSDNAESDFTAEEITDGTLTTWTGANDGFAVTWYNQGTGGASYDVSNAVAVEQPLLVSSGVVHSFSTGSGLDFSVGGANGASLDGSAFTELDSGNDFTVFCANKRIANGDWQGILCTSPSPATPARLTLFNGCQSAGYQSYVYNGSIQYTGTLGSELAGGDYIMTWTVDGTAKQITSYYNDSVGDTLAAPWTGSYGNTVTQIGNDRGVEHGETISEMLIFNSDKTSEKDDIIDNINARYPVF